MNLIGGSEFDESDFLLFAQKLKEFTYNTYRVLNNDDNGEYKEALTKYKKHIKDELLDSYDKKSKFNDLNEIVVQVAKDSGYQELSHSGSDELYDFTGMTEKVLKKIGIYYVLTEDELDAIRNVLESSSSSSSRSSSRNSDLIISSDSSSSRSSSRSSSSSSSSSSINPSVSSRGSKKKKKKSKKKRKKKINKSKKRKRSKKTKKR